MSDFIDEYLDIIDKMNDNSKDETIRIFKDMIKTLLDFINVQEYAKTSQRYKDLDEIEKTYKNVNKNDYQSLQESLNTLSTFYDNYKERVKINLRLGEAIQNGIEFCIENQNSKLNECRNMEQQHKKNQVTNLVFIALIKNCYQKLLYYFSEFNTSIEKELIDKGYVEKDGITVITRKSKKENNVLPTLQLIGEVIRDRTQHVIAVDQLKKYINQKTGKPFSKDYLKKIQNLVNT